MRRVGTKRAGHVLDGQIWQLLPAARDTVTGRSADHGRVLRPCLWLRASGSLISETAASLAADVR